MIYKATISKMTPSMTITITTKLNYTQRFIGQHVIWYYYVIFLFVVMIIVIAPVRGGWGAIGFEATFGE